MQSSFDPGSPGQRPKRIRAIKVALPLLVLAGAIVWFVIASTKPRIVSVAITQRLRDSLDLLEQAANSGNVKGYLSSHESTATALLDWIDDFREHASIDTAFVIDDEEVCAGCTLLPRAVRALAAPVPTKVLERMTQLDKDRFDAKKIPWAVFRAFVPVFEVACDRYVDPKTGRLRPAKPD